MGQDAAPAPVDHGSVDQRQSSRPAVAMVMGFLLGFGLGHWVAGDVERMVLFLILDAALLTTTLVLDVLVQGGPYAVLGILGLVASHIFQGFDAYREAGGDPLLAHENPRLRPLVAARGPDRGLAPVSRLFRWAF